MSESHVDAGRLIVPTIDDKPLFDAVRSILIDRTGKGLTQAEVDKIKRSLAAIFTATTPSREGMAASREAIDLIHSFESLRLQAYRDPGSRDGLPITIGWGSTSDLQGRPIKLGDVWTREQADAKFAQDLAAFEAGVNRLLDGAPTTQNQFDALVSFAYNVGLAALGGSSLLRFHKAGDYHAAKNAFASWKYSGGKVMPGLVRRRAAEAELYGRGL